ncbi:hypothetical protein B0H14DRAFT_2561996 [Mycena olivaceomarginata]|nr:hypothetical protein B0H14DRAFT_2561996 [Mycena olivaceomarginata]
MSILNAKSASTDPHSAGATIAVDNHSSSTELENASPALPTESQRGEQKKENGDFADDTIRQKEKGGFLTTKMVPDDDISEDFQELPEIYSEYSDSDNEGEPRTFDPPSWARKDPSIFTPTTAIPVMLNLNRNGSGKIEGEKSAKKAKDSKKSGTAPSKRRSG